MAELIPIDVDEGASWEADAVVLLDSVFPELEAKPNRYSPAKLIFSHGNHSTPTNAAAPKMDDYVLKLLPCVKPTPIPALLPVRS